MAVEDRDVAALTHLAMRIRQETYGAGPWDQPGTAKIIAELKGRNLLITTEHIIRNAADPKAKSPGVLRGAYTPPPPAAETVRRGVLRAEQCTRCGGRLPDCACTRERLVGDVPDEIPEHPMSPKLAAKLAKILTPEAD